MSAPVKHRIEVEEFHRMVDAGVFGPEDRLELVAGEIIEMAPIGSRHAEITTRLQEALSGALDGLARVRIQNPVVLSRFHEIQPDLAVLRPRSYAKAHPGPGDVLLVIEVSDTSLAYDRDVKLPAYAASAIAEVWLVVPTEDLIEVHRKPVAGSYTETLTVRPDQAISPAAFPEIRVEIRQIFA
ncbi:MAG: Uma2 family endonuclease [Actinomycetota bacterium]